MSLPSTSSSHMAVVKTTVLGLPLLATMSILAGASPAWSLHVTLTADDLSPRVSDQGLVLIGDSGGTGSRGAGQGPPTGTGPRSGMGTTGGTGKAVQVGPDPVVAWEVRVQLKGRGIRMGSANSGGAGSPRGSAGSSMGGGTSSSGSGGSGSGGGGR
jgi:hypothetical protein